MNENNEAVIDFAEMWKNVERKVVSICLAKRLELVASDRWEDIIQTRRARWLLNEGHEQKFDYAWERPQLRLSLYFEERSAVHACCEKMWEMREIFLIETRDDLLSVKSNKKTKLKRQSIVERCPGCWLGWRAMLDRKEVMENEHWWFTKNHEFSLCYCHELEQPTDSDELFEHVLKLYRKCTFHAKSWDVMNEIALETARSNILHTPIVYKLLQHAATARMYVHEDKSKKRKNEESQNEESPMCVD